MLQTAAAVGIGATVGAGSAEVDASSGGDLVWEFTDPAARVFSSPTVRDGTVYVASGEEDGSDDIGVLYAVDASTGNQEWEYQALEFAESSPTVVGGIVYFATNTYSLEGEVHAVNADTGDQEWVFDAPGSWVFSSPTLYEGTVYVGCNDGTLYAIDAATGTEEWAFTEPTDEVRPSPTVADGTVYFGTSTGTVYAVDAETGDQVWDYTDPTDEILSSPTVYQGSVYIGAGSVLGEETDSTLYAINAGTGEREWQFEVPEENVRSSPTAYQGTVYVGSDDSTLYAIDANTGEQEWEFDNMGPSGYVYCSPTVAGGTVFVGETEIDGDNVTGALYAVDADTGDELWTFADPTDGVISSPTVVDGTAYFGADDSTLYAVDTDVSASSEGSRVNRGTLGHHFAWDGTDPEPGDPGTVTGTVTDESDSPIEGASVALLNSGTEVASTTTDSAGDYSLTADPGTYTLEVAKDGYDTITKQATIPDGGSTTVDVTLPEETPDPGTVLGTVTDESDSAIESASVALLDSGSEVASTTTDSAGDYSLTAAPSTYTLEVAKDGYETATQEVTIQEGQDTTVDVTLSEVPSGSGTVLGTITDQNDDPLDGVSVTLLDGGSEVASTTTDSTGSYSLTAAPSTYTLEAQKASYGSVTQEVSIQEGQDTTVNLTLSDAAPPPLPGYENSPTDPDGDGTYEDIDGNGKVDIFDVQALFDNLDSDAVQNNVQFYDFDGNGKVDIFDVQTLFSDLN